MKVSKVYEVWVGGDLIDEQLDLHQALVLARNEFKEHTEKYPEEKPDVVIDEHTYIEIESLEDLDTIDNDPKWQ